jgi:hypothetical protein
MSASDWIAGTAALFTLAGVWLVWGQLGALSKQIKLQHYSEYTKRYQEIMLQFPEDINQVDFQLSSERKDYGHVMRYMRAYFDLSFEEWDLNNKNLIEPQFWETWMMGIRTALSKPAFQQAWEKIKSDSTFGSSFEAFIETCKNHVPYRSVPK